MKNSEKILRAINYCIAMIAPVSADMQISSEDHEMLGYLYVQYGYERNSEIREENERSKDNESNEN